MRWALCLFRGLCQKTSSRDDRYRWRVEHTLNGTYLHASKKTAWAMRHADIHLGAGAIVLRAEKSSEGQVEKRRSQ